jgi:hypothetical protein
MSMKRGSTGISGAYVGTTEIKKIYRGTTLIFEKDTGGGGGGGGGGGAAADDSLWGAVRLLVPFETSANSVTHADGGTVSGTESGTSGSPSSAVSADGKFSNGWTHYQGTVTYSTGAFNSNNWTVEFWFKRNANYQFTPNKTALVFGDFEFKHASNNNFILYQSDDEESLGSFGTAALDTWEHYAIVYQNGTTRLYKGGTQINSSSGVQSAPSSLVVGDSSSLYNFSLDDLRVTDAARYPGGTTFSVPTAAHGTSSGTGKLDVNNDGKARFYLPSAATSFKVSANTSTGFFKISSAGKTDVIGEEHNTYNTYHTVGGGAFKQMTGLASGATKTVIVSSCTAAGVDSGNIIGIDIGSDSTNNITGVDISGLTSLATFHAGATGGSITGKFNGGMLAGTRSMVSSITEIRAVNVDFNTANGYTTPYGPTTVYAAAGGIDLYYQQLDATALNQLYTDLSSGTGGGGIFVGGNPGASSDTPSIASNYSVHG